MKEQVNSPFKVGTKYLFRTVTHIDVGEVKEITGKFATLKNASWIADTGRFADALKDTDKFNEVEPYTNDCIVNLDSLIDATEIDKLPTEQK